MIRGILPGAQSQAQTAPQTLARPWCPGGAVRTGGVGQRGFLGEVTLLLGRKDSSGSLQGEQLRPPLLGHPELGFLPNG